MSGLQVTAIYAGLISVPAAWITHIWVTISAKAWGLFAAGVLLPPLGIVHGYATWFGFDWIN